MIFKVFSTKDYSTEAEQTSIFRQLFDNDEIREQILPILFPNGKTFAMLKSHFNQKSALPIYQALIEKIDQTTSI
jgi:hypothetical protein